MSEYQKRKEEALKLQRQKEEQLARELAEKAEKDKQRAKEEAEKKRLRDAAAVEARRKELARANEALNLGKGQSAGTHEWDPFADDERPKTTLATTTNTLIKTHGRPSTGNGASGRPANAKAGPSQPRSSTKSANGSSTTNGKTKDGNSPPPLGRLEKRARAFAQQAMKSGKNESIFSVRSLVESMDGPVSGSTSPRPKTSSSSTKSRNPISMGNGKGRAGIGMNAGLVKGGNFKDQLNKSLKGEGMRKLCPDRDKRDKRTIDEIQTEIRSRKNPLPPPPKVKPKPAPIPTTARPPASGRRQRSPSSSSTSSYESDRPRKRPKEDRYDYSQSQVSAEIQALFRRPGMAERRYVDEFSDDGSSDMEAGLSDVEMEEKRTAAIARREDEMAEREERERKLAKEKAKREKMKGR